MKSYLTGKLKALQALLVILVCISIFNLEADTVLTAPDGKNVCYGQNIFKCKLNPQDPTKEYLCLLMGNWNGISVIAPVDQTDKAVSERLYLVSLKSSTEANFNFLEQNIIRIKGASLSKYLKNDKAFGSWRGQLCQWTNSTLPSGDPRQNQLFITSQYDKDGFDIFNIVNINTKKPEYPILEAQFFINNKIPAGTHGSYYITALDVLDINTFAKDAPPDTMFPKSLMIWAKIDGQTGSENLQLTAPSTLLVCDYNPETLATLSQTLDFPFTARTSSATTDDKNSFCNITGGFITSSLPDGRIAYFYSLASGFVNGSYKGHGVSVYSGTLSTNGLPVTVENNKIKLQEASGVCSYTFKHSIHDTPNKAAQPLWIDWNQMNPGPTFVIEDDKFVGIVPYTQRNATAVYTKEKDAPKIKTELYKQIGTMTDIPEEILKDITTYIRTDKEPATKEEQIDYMMKDDGVCVYAVMYGWPYFAWESGVSQKDYPKIRQEESSSCLSAEDWGNGAGTDIELGYGWGNKDKGISGKTGSKSQYEFKHNQGSEVKKSITTTFTVSKDATISTEDYANSGIIFYTRSNPVIFNGGYINPVEPYPGKNSTYRIWAKGLEKYNFVMSFASASIEPEKNGAFTRQCFFNLGNPEKLTIADDFSDERFCGNTYSPLSKGLPPKPSALITFRDHEELNTKFNEIRDFQKDSQFAELLKRASAGKSTPQGMGVYPYLQIDSAPEFDGGVPYNLQKESNIKYNDAKTFKFSDAHSWSEGFTWDYSIPGFYSKGSISYKGSVSFINQDSKTKGFDISVPGCLSAGSRGLILYVFYIDIPMLKNGLYLSGELEKPFYVPDYCWDNNNSFMLIIPYVPDKTM